jgi:hypothetical protein
MSIIVSRCLLLLAIAVTILTTDLQAELTVGTPAPDFPKNAVWLNGKSLSLKNELKGEVVLVDFWEYT